MLIYIISLTFLKKEKNLDAGKQIRDYFNSQMKMVIKHHALPFELDVENGWIINFGRLFASEIGNELAKINNSFAIVWTLTDKKKISCLFVL